MNYSDIDKKSNCLDQILIIIFVILIIFIVMFYLNPKERHDKDEKFKGKMNYASVSYDDDDILGIKNQDYNTYSETEMINYPIENKSMMVTYSEMNDTDKFLKRINDKYRSAKFEDDIENFSTLNNENYNNQNYNNQNYNTEVPIKNLVVEPFAHQGVNHEEQNNVNDLSKPENISGFLNGDIACNMDQQQKELVDDYKKKYFRMYRHQIECPKECQLHKLNLNRCNLSDNNDCQGIFTKDYNNPDVFTLSNLVLDRNNKRECVACTANDDRQTRNMMGPNSNINEEDEVKINERRLNNRNKFADFNDYIDRNGVLETSVDKIAELRTSSTGTCGLNSFGQKVSDVYNNLLSTTYTEEKNRCVNGPVEGISNSNFDDSYASPI